MSIISCPELPCPGVGEQGEVEYGERTCGVFGNNVCSFDAEYDKCYSPQDCQTGQALKCSEAKCSKFPLCSTGSVDPNCSPFSGRNVCRIAQPTMTKQTTASCCLNKYTTRDAVGVCAKGWCGDATTGTPACFNAMLSLCSDSSDPNILEMWANKPSDPKNDPKLTGVCREFLLQNPYMNENPERRREFFQTVVSKLGKTPYQKGDGFNAVMADICGQVPGSCDSFLSQMCGANSVGLGPISRQQAASDKELRKLCSCFLSDLQYPFAGKFGVECDILCNDASVNPVPKAEPKGNTWVKKDCQQNVCILDNVVVDILNSEVGGINLSQVCPSSGPGVTQCYLDGVTVDVVNSSVKDGINLGQWCSGCSNEDGAGISCGDNGGGGGSGGNTGGNFLKDILLFGGIGLILLLLLGVVIWFLFK